MIGPQDAAPTEPTGKANALGWSMTERQLLIIGGALAIFGGVLNGFSDYLLQGGFAAGPGVNTFENLVDAPFEPVFWGSVIGYAAMPLWLLILLPLYHCLRPAGFWNALTPVCLLGYAMALIPGYHHSYALYAAGFQAAAEDPGAVLNAQLLRIHSGALSVFQGPLGISGVWIAALILFGKTKFPRWVFFISPLLTPLTQPFIETLPAPWGAFIRPPWGTMLFTAFFAVTLWTYCARGENTKRPAA